MFLMYDEPELVDALHEHIVDYYAGSVSASSTPRPTSSTCSSSAMTSAARRVP